MSKKLLILESYAPPPPPHWTSMEPKPLSAQVLLFVRYSKRTRTFSGVAFATLMELGSSSRKVVMRCISQQLNIMMITHRDPWLRGFGVTGHERANIAMVTLYSPQVFGETQHHYVYAYCLTYGRSNRMIYQGILSKESITYSYGLGGM